MLNKKIKSPRWKVSKGLEEKYPKEIIEYFYKKDDFEKTFFDTEINSKLTNEYVMNSVGIVDGKVCERIVNSILKDI